MLITGNSPKKVILPALPRPMSTRRTKDGLTALRLLLDRGADVDAKNKDGVMELIWADASGQEALMRAAVRL
jgi:hypothetical protein